MSGAEPVEPARPARRTAFAILFVVLALAATAWAGWWLLLGSRFETTDNAYVHAPMVQVTSQVAGTVLAVAVEETDTVAAGHPLVRLDPTDARLALDKAEAQLAQVVREVRQLHAHNATLASTVRQREAEAERSLAELHRSQADLARRRPLVEGGAVAAEELQHAEAAWAAARSAAAAAQSALAAARDQAAANRVLTDGATPAGHPSVERAAAAVREAWLALRRTELPAPVAGQVARRTVQVGQRIAAGSALLSLVPLDQVWVEANFKESQLRRMRVGQRVTLHSDLYGREVVFEGRIAGFGAGTGAAFALLPAQNATGNWIKVVQRVPVRIELEAGQLAEHPLRVGLSMHASVDLADAEPAPAAASVSPRASSRTSALVDLDAEAEQRIRRIVAAQPGSARR